MFSVATRVKSSLLFFLRFIFIYVSLAFSVCTGVCTGVCVHIYTHAHTGNKVLQIKIQITIQMSSEDTLGYKSYILHIHYKIIILKKPATNSYIFFLTREKKTFHL